MPTKLAGALGLTLVLGSIFSLLIERYVPDNRKSPVYSITKDDPNKELFDQIDWMNRVQSAAKIVEARGSYYRCFILRPNFKERTVTLDCTNSGITTQIKFDQFHVD